MRRRKLGVDVGGYTLAVAGIAAIVISEAPGGVSVTALATVLGRVGLVIGVVLVCYASLARRGIATDETYRIGYDLGFEAGYAARGEAAGARPVVVPLHRCACQVSETGAAGEPASVSVVASATDRG